MVLVRSCSLLPLPLPLPLTGVAASLFAPDNSCCWLLPSSSEKALLPRPRVTPPPPTAEAVLLDVVADGGGGDMLRCAAMGQWPTKLEARIRASERPGGIAKEDVDRDRW